MSAELVAQRRLTRQRIKMNGVTISVIRSVKVATDRGGQTSSPSTLRGQQVLITDLTANELDDLSSTLGLTGQRERHLLVGVWDMDLKYQDEFALGTKRFYVVWVDEAHRTYETKALVEQLV